MSKSADAFRTISEVADWLGVQAHVLRFWESKFTQVKPVKRAGGRRYYRPVDMLLLGGIKRLLHEEGLTIKGVQKILREKGIAHVSAMSVALDEGDESTPQAEPAAYSPAPLIQETKPALPVTSGDEAIPEAPFSEDVPIEAEPTSSVVSLNPALDTPAPARPSFTQDAVVMPEPQAAETASPIARSIPEQPTTPSVSVQPTEPSIEPVEEKVKASQTPAELTENDPPADPTSFAPETETSSEPQFEPHPLPQSSSSAPSADLDDEEPDDDAPQQEHTEPEAVLAADPVVEAPAHPMPPLEPSVEGPNLETEQEAPETVIPEIAPAPPPEAEPEFEGTPDLFASTRVDPTPPPQPAPIQEDAPVSAQTDDELPVEPVLDAPAVETEPQPAPSAPQTETQEAQPLDTAEEKLVLPSFLHNRTPGFLDRPVTPVAESESPKDLSFQTEEASAPLEETAVPPVELEETAAPPAETVSEEVEISAPPEPSSHDAVFGPDFANDPETTEDVAPEEDTAEDLGAQDNPELETAAPVDVPADASVEDIAQVEETPEPVVETPKKPLIIDVVEPGPESDISVTPSVLSALAQDRILDTQQANAIEPLLAHLTQLRDRMSQARKE